MTIDDVRRTPLLRALLAAGVVLIPALTPVLAQAPLKARRDFGVGDHPVAIAAGDLDNDGYLDLVTADQISSNLSILKGFGDGTFRVVRTITAGSLPSGIALVDLNGDGKLDLVASNFRSLDVTVNFGDGTGNFGAKISSSVSANPVALALGDWNNDGKIDVATANTQQNKISVLLGDGAGHFATLRQFTTASTPRWIAAGDFNKDGKADLVVVNGVGLANGMQIFRGDGTGNFALSSAVATGNSPSTATVADLNGDGNLDLVVSNTPDEQIGVYLGSAGGTFGTATLYSPGFGPKAILPVDINKDGLIDLVVTLGEVSGEGQVAELLGTGTGTFGAPVLHGTGPQPNSAVAADFNKDGLLDVATANNTGNTVSILQNTGGGVFLAANKITLPVGSFPAAVVAADFNLDGKPDVATSNEFLNNVTVALGDCLGGFTSVNSANNTGVTPIAMTAIDLNGDGDPDIVTANNGDDTFSILQNSGAANFTVTNGTSIDPSLTCTSTVGIASGELSGNNIPDLSFVCEVNGVLCTRQGTGGSGAAAFGPPVCTTVGGTSEGVVMGNFNQDALNDVAISASALNVVQIGLSNGSGGLTDIPGTFPVATSPKGLARGDLNGDGFQDLVVADSGSAKVSALLGDGGGAFSFPSLDAQAGQAPYSVALADFNLDGKLDAAVVDTNANNVSLFLGDGAGHLTLAGFYGVRDQPLGIAAGDFNCDGKPDVAVVDNFNDTVSLLLNQSVAGDPLQATNVYGQSATVFRWGVVPGATYDVIRGQVKLVTQGSTTFNLGAVTCLANDLTVTDTAATPDSTVPPLGDAWFYAVRTTVNGVVGQYTVATNGKPGVPASGDCP
jgi:hypothetical protein